MRRTALLLFMVLANLGTLRAQSEYRIKQEIPNDIDSVDICAGWEVKLSQGAQASVTIVTPCSAFFDDEAEPEVCSIEGRSLTLLKNNTLPKSTVIEIVLAKPIKSLNVQAGAHLTTGDLTFDRLSNSIDINEGATVVGQHWHDEGGMLLFVSDRANVKLDSLTAEKYITIHQWWESNLECPVVLSPDTKIKKSKQSTGTDYQTDTALHMTVKRLNNNFTRRFEMALSGGITAPIPLYMNNTSGSPYNRGESYRAMLQLTCQKPVQLTNRLSFTPSVRYEWECSRLLNSVAVNSNALVLDNSVGAERPQQHLIGDYIGFHYGLRYQLSKNWGQSQLPGLRLDFGLSAMRNIGGHLTTRTMGSDNRWTRTKEKVEVFNPWQLRLTAGIGGGPLTMTTLNLTYDLLPTFRKGVGADNVHTFGVSISF